ncbi:MAG: NfeD family protein [Oscillospiraceae bacterium]|nr:NfeD family protein [Oscillospiraceae bacterium]
MTTWMIIWGIIFIGMVILELCTMQLISVWFAAGSLAAFIAAALNVPPLGQAIIFTAASVLLLIATKPILKKFKVGNKIPTNLDAEIGRSAVVTQEINEVKNTGRVKIGGVNWRARTRDGSVIAAGTTVKVMEISGTTAYVEIVSEVEH